MKVVDPCYEKLVKEFIVKITSECIVEGNKEYIKVCDRGKCVKFSPQTSPLLVMVMRLVLPQSVLTLSYILNIGKDVADNVIHICAPVDKTDMVFDGEMLELFHLKLLLLLLKCFVMYVLVCSCVHYELDFSITVAHFEKIKGR